MDPLSSCPGLLTGEVGGLGCDTGEGCTGEAGKVGGGGGGGRDGVEAGMGARAVVATAGVAWGASSLGLSIVRKRLTTDSNPFNTSCLHYF
jgi:hypothetical protein